MIDNQKVKLDRAANKNVDRHKGHDQPNLACQTKTGITGSMTPLVSFEKKKKIFDILNMRIKYNVLFILSLIVCSVSP